MNKKNIILLSLGLFFIVPIYVFGAEQLFKTVTAMASFPIARIIHNEIKTVSSVRGILDAKISVDFGNYTSATAKIRYYLNGESSNILEKEKGAIQHEQDFYISLPKFDSDDTQVDYQIMVTFDNTSYVYWPSSGTATVYQTVNIVESSSKTITATGGGTVTFESGNQQYGDTKIVFSSGTFTADQAITITELSTPNTVSSMNKVSKKGSQMVAMYSVTPLGLTFSVPARATFYYGTETAATKFDLMRSDDQITWEKVSNITIDLANKTVSADITKSGYYAIYTSSNLEDNDYRPAKRVIVQGRDVFKFNNLTDGDSVKIYNINGKRIKEISSGDAEGFKWDGRRDSGSYAESGTYVYQIKVKEKGKLISGTIAFVK
ncbi:MAG: FlgD immunoglobulin-like domain containing protein [Endomicrobiaceae bacterium]|nr:FlgD immunoglobulin-like domain containing protein [Endomicrobiaceae bacterium]